MSLVISEQPAQPVAATQTASLAPLRTAATIFVLCPAGMVTGGPELLHQLVHNLRRLGRDARIAYVPEGPAETPAAYLGYACPVADRIVDAPGNLIVSPETLTGHLRRVRHARCAIWWLSVDNYAGNFATPVLARMRFRRLLHANGADRPGVIDLCQSHYARDFVRQRFGRVGVMLSDHLNDEFLPPTAASHGAPRDAVVLYNPRKDSVFGRCLRLLARDIHFVPLQNMSRAQVIERMRSAKVYIDFGFHPGKDRIPREAAMCGCAVVVVRLGAARNDLDVPLPQRYKLEPDLASLGAARRLLRHCLDDNDAALAAQDEYRQSIGRERAAFLEQVSELFAGRPAASAALS